MKVTFISSEEFISYCTLFKFALKINKMQVDASVDFEISNRVIEKMLL